MIHATAFLESRKYSLFNCELMNLSLSSMFFAVKKGFTDGKSTVNSLRQVKSFAYGAEFLSIFCENSNLKEGAE